ncbi:MAG: nicotinate phosphoribosyltransferase [Patescibacteria group bacterium]
MFDFALRRDTPIIQSLLDRDFYKDTMGQLIFLKYPKVPVKFVFKNRTDGIRLAEEIDIHELDEQLKYCRTLRVNNSEEHYMRGTNEYQDRMFDEPYLQFIRGYSLPDYELTVQSDGQIGWEVANDWPMASPWETIFLAVVNELYYRNKLRKMTRFERDALFSEGVKKLEWKIKLLRQYPEIKFTDFGTRRRFSSLWQKYVVEVMQTELPNQLVGTSNTLLAMQLGLLPMGTSAHEMYMGLYGIMHDSDERILASHNQTIKDWWEQYGFGLSIALTDTYGSDFFFRDFTLEQARLWKGLRHDSGDPFIFGEKAIKFYQNIGIDPKEKMVVFSDGLDVNTIIALWVRFHDRIKVSFGWGTNLTNDLGLPSLSMVVKLLESCGISTVKLSDNLAKAMGSKPELSRSTRIFGYLNKESQACIY